MNTNQAELTNLIQAEIHQNNHQMLEAMQKMLDNSVSQLKRSASESAESQLQEIKKLKYNEPSIYKSIFYWQTNLNSDGPLSTNTKNTS